MHDPSRGLGQCDLKQVVWLCRLVVLTKHTARRGIKTHNQESEERFSVTRLQLQLIDSSVKSIQTRKILKGVHVL